jgi:hypothetical protein
MAIIVTMNPHVLHTHTSFAIIHDNDTLCLYNFDFVVADDDIPTARVWVRFSVRGRVSAFRQ